MPDAHIEFLCEERSMQVTLDLLLRQLLPERITNNVVVFSGKPDLLGKLPQRLRGYSYGSTPYPLGLCVLLDEDREECRTLKATMERAARTAGFATKSHPDRHGHFQVLNRIVVEELEAWFFGDVEALRTAYPRLPDNLTRRTPYRDPDAVKGGTSQALERLLQRAGYHAGGLRKLQAAEAVASAMVVEKNTSASFQHFVRGLRALLAALVDKGAGRHAP